MFKIRRPLTSSALCITMFFSLNSVAHADMSLQDAIKAATSTDPNIAALTQDVANAGVKIEAERDAYFPSFQLSGGAANDGDPEISISASQVLYDWGKTKTLIENASQDRVLAVSDLKQGMEDLAFDVGALFLEAKKHKTKAKLSELYVNFAKKVLDKVEGRVSAGLSDRSEITRSQLEVAKAENMMARAISDYEISISQIEYMTGTDVQSLSFSDYQPLAQYIYELGGLSAILESAPDVSKANAAVLKAESDIHLAKAQRLPTINLRAKGSRSLRDNRNNGSIGVYFDMDIGSRSLRGRDLQSAEIALKAAMSRLEGEKRMLGNDAETSLKMINVLTEAADDQARQVEETVKVLLAYQEQFESGTRDLIDTLTIGQELYTIQVELLDLLEEIGAMEFSTARDLGILMSYIGR